MNGMTDILVPLDGSPDALKAVPVAGWLASSLKAHLHVLWAGAPMPAAETFGRLGIERKFHAMVELHQMAAAPSEAILTMVQARNIDLVIMTARGESAALELPEPDKIVGHVTREVIEAVSAPVLVLPPNYEEALPWRSMLVPMSGEPATDEAIAVALHLAHTLDLNVNVAHVAGVAPAGEEEAEGRYADEMHHEFAQMLNQFVARACPMCSAVERARVRAFYIKHGDVGDELLEMIETMGIGLLVVGWHGEFMVGHAQVLKRLIRQISRPILLVKPGPRPRFRLKVGEAFE